MWATGSLQKIRKSMQIRMSVVQTNQKMLCLNNFFCEMTLLQPVFFSISNFWYKLTLPTSTMQPQFDPTLPRGFLSGLYSVRKFNWWRYCAALLYVTKFFTISLYFTCWPSSVKYSQIRQNSCNSVYFQSGVSLTSAFSTLPLGLLAPPRDHFFGSV